MIAGFLSKSAWHGRIVGVIINKNINEINKENNLLKGRQINENTLLIFDEVQECPNIISSLRYFCQDYRPIPVIATGSMVRIKIQRETHKRGNADNAKFLFLPLFL